MSSFKIIRASIGDKIGLKKNTRDVVFAEVTSIALKYSAYPIPVTQMNTYKTPGIVSRV